VAEFEEKLNSILGDQAAMGQIMALAQSLSGNSGGGGGESAPPAEEAPGEHAQSDSPAPPIQEMSGVNGGDIFSLLGDIDPRMIQMGIQLMQQFRNQDDKSVRLLNALRPFLKEERQQKLDRTIQVASLSRIIRMLFRSMKEKGEADHV